MSTSPLDAVYFKTMLPRLFTSSLPWNLFSVSITNERPVGIYTLSRHVNPHTDLHWWSHTRRICRWVWKWEIHRQVDWYFYRVDRRRGHALQRQKTPGPHRPETRPPSQKPLLQTKSICHHKFPYIGCEHVFLTIHAGYPHTCWDLQMDVWVCREPHHRLQRTTNQPVLPG